MFRGGTGRDPHPLRAARKVTGMENQRELRDFLVSRRAKITPEAAGLSTYRGVRRVPGLRRTEVAQLAGVSVEYYTRVERGNVKGVSDSVLNAISRALQLDEAERSHLFDLSRANDSNTRRKRTATQRRVRPAIQQLLDAMSDVPAIVQNGRLDLLAANTLGKALFSVMFETIEQSGEPQRIPNFARFTFLNRDAVDTYPEWSKIAGEIVALLRVEAGHYPSDRELNELIGELASGSEKFSTLWAEHNVRWHSTGSKRLHHPIVGELLLNFEALQLTADPGLSLVTFTAEPGTASHQAIGLLSSWSKNQGRNQSPNEKANGTPRGQPAQVTLT